MTYQPSFSPPTPRSTKTCFIRPELTPSLLCTTPTSSSSSSSSSSSRLKNGSLNKLNLVSSATAVRSPGTMNGMTKRIDENGNQKSVVVDVALSSPQRPILNDQDAQEDEDESRNLEMSIELFDEQEENQKRKMLLIVDDEEDDDENEDEDGLGADAKKLQQADEQREVKFENRLNDSFEQQDDNDSEGDDDDDRPILHVEVRLKPDISIRIDRLKPMIHQYLRLQSDPSSPKYLDQNTELESSWKEIAVLEMYIDRIWIAESDHPSERVPVSEVDLEIHIYQPSSTTRTSDCFISPNSDDEEGDGDQQDGPAASVLDLPSMTLEGIWDNLIYEEPVKENLLNYIHSSLEFSERNVDFNIVAWNRVCLLHGPPGSGKTSLCRALAQKLAIRLSETYSFGRLIEINSHSLFSKWFSESGKLVQKLFASVTEMVEDEDGFAVVLIDEVESLTAARAGAMSGKEPSDALRVVNALLTQLDKLKARKNCLVITTSNLSEAIDPAFIDRADIKQYVGLPPAAAIYWILRTSLLELMSKNLIRSEPIIAYETLLKSPNSSTSETITANQLLDLAKECKGMSGRTLRKLPILAHAKVLNKKKKGKVLGLKRWLDGIAIVVKEEKRQRDLIDPNRRDEI